MEHIYNNFYIKVTRRGFFNLYNNKEDKLRKILKNIYDNNISIIQDFFL